MVKHLGRILQLYLHDSQDSAATVTLVVLSQPLRDSVLWSRVVLGHAFSRMNLRHMRAHPFRVRMWYL